MARSSWAIPAGFDSTLPVRSAEPPTSSGKWPASRASAFWLPWRIGIASAAVAVWSTACFTAASSPPGNVPAMRRSNSARISAGTAARRCSHASRSAAPRRPASRQGARSESGTSKAACSHPRLRRSPASSSAPRGEPCTTGLPSLVGAPKPMRVRAAIIVGRSAVRAKASASSIAAGSWPSIATVAQPEASKRLHWSSEVASAVPPSMVVPLSSKITVSLASLRWPASEIASWLTPSIRHPSPAKTQVRWSTRSAPNSARSSRSAIAMPTAAARPWPSGPVVVSIPAMWPYSGWAAVRDRDFRKRFSSSSVASS